MVNDLKEVRNRATESPARGDARATQTRGRSAVKPGVTAGITTSIRAAASDFEARRLLRQTARHRRERVPGTGPMLVPSLPRYQACPLSKPGIYLCAPELVDFGKCYTGITYSIKSAVKLIRLLHPVQPLGLSTPPVRNWSPLFLNRMLKAVNEAEVSA
jgi:hypothetical protein